MSRKLLTAAALGVLALPVASAHAQVGFGVAAGLSSPSSDLGKSVDAGYHATGILTLSAPLSPLGGRVEGSFNQFNFKSSFAPASGAKTNIVSGTVNGTFSAPGMMGVYLIAGLGMYKPTCSSCGVGVTNPSAKLGYNGGAGFKFGLSGFSAFVEARYHHFTTSSSGFNTNWSYIPVSFGLLF
jgi:hypothetical protein